MLGKQPMNPKKVPEILRPCIPLIEKWAPLGPSDELHQAALRLEANPEALKELEEFPKLWTEEHEDAFVEWQDREPITVSQESSRFGLFFALLDTLGVSMIPKGRDWVAHLMSDLAKPGGDTRAVRRMHAARDLPDHGPEAKRAVPLLKKALADEGAQVQIWAHVALSLIEGDLDTHREAIRRIARERGRQEKGWVQLEANEAIEHLAKTPHERDVEALTSAAILGDPVNARRLVERVDVNARDQHGGVALSYAVNSCKTDVVELLLDHGADPNIRRKDGKSFLHDAAWQRKSPPIIELLVKHGADVNARDSEGQTPLDVAKFRNRTENAQLLRRLGAAD
jgi:hypothetical protein